MLLYRECTVDNDCHVQVQQTILIREYKSHATEESLRME
jgi:hypothetical protein